MVSYDEHLAFLVKQERGDHAERQGFIDARLFDKPMKFSEDRYEQSRYADGFFTGKEKIQFNELIIKLEEGY